MNVATGRFHFISRKDVLTRTVFPSLHMRSYTSTCCNINYCVTRQIWRVKCVPYFCTFVIFILSYILYLSFFVSKRIFILIVIFLHLSSSIFRIKTIFTLQFLPFFVFPSYRLFSVVAAVLHSRICFRAIFRVQLIYSLGRNRAWYRTRGPSAGIEAVGKIAQRQISPGRIRYSWNWNIGTVNVLSKWLFDKTCQSIPVEETNTEKLSGKPGICTDLSVLKIRTGVPK